MTSPNKIGSRGTIRRWLAVCAMLIAVTGCDRRGDQPNIIFILTDDLGYNDIGCYWTENPNPDYENLEAAPPQRTERIDTPHIDRLAEEGVRLTSFYAGASVCTPARAAFLTGCYPSRVGLSSMGPENDPVLHPRSPYGLNPDEVTIAEVLRERGYATGVVGKWHLGFPDMFNPLHHGFDEFYGVHLGGPEYSEMKRGEEDIPPVSRDSLTLRFTEEAIDFIKRHRKKPFFLYLAHNMPHTPVAVRPEFRGKSARGIYGDAIVELDWSVGEIMKTIEELGLADVTLTIFTSDNGPMKFADDSFGQAFPFRGGKAWPTEGGFRVPCIVHWPGHTPTGETYEDIITMMDWLPTFASVTGDPLALEQTIDGKDVWPAIQGGESPHETFFYYRRGSLDAIRKGKWKLLYRSDGEPDGTEEVREAIYLYNIRRDPAEQDDVIHGFPGIADELSRLAVTTRLELGDTRTGVEGWGVRPAGKAEPPPRKGKANRRRQHQD